MQLDGANALQADLLSPEDQAAEDDFSAAFDAADEIDDSATASAESPQVDETTDQTTETPPADEASTTATTDDEDGELDPAFILKDEDEDDTNQQQAESTAAAGQPGASKPGQAPAADDPWKDVNPIVKQTLQQLTAQLGAVPKLEHRLSSELGRMNKALQTVSQKAVQDVAAAGGSAPTQQQVTAAVKQGGAKWDAFRKEWPEFAEAFDERMGEQQQPAAQVQVPDVATLTSSVVEQLAPHVQAIQEEARAHARIEAKHENWQETIKTAEFGAFLDRIAPIVPTANEIAAVRQSFNAGDYDTGNARVRSLQAAYPDWDKAGGALRFSADPKDAVRLLDIYAERRAKQQRQQNSRNRLSNAIQPRGTGTRAPQTIDDEAAFTRGFGS